MPLQTELWQAGKHPGERAWRATRGMVAEAGRVLLGTKETQVGQAPPHPLTEVQTLVKLCGDDQEP